MPVIHLRVQLLPTQQPLLFAVLPLRQFLCNSILCCLYFPASLRHHSPRLTTRLPTQLSKPSWRFLAGSGQEENPVCSPSHFVESSHSPSSSPQCISSQILPPLRNWILFLKKNLSHTRSEWEVRESEQVSDIYSIITLYFSSRTSCWCIAFVVGIGSSHNQNFHTHLLFDFRLNCMKLLIVHSILT